MHDRRMGIEKRAGAMGIGAIGHSDGAHPGARFTSNRPPQAKGGATVHISSFFLPFRLVEVDRSASREGVRF